ncbi:putative DNA-binding transcriptional regulator [Serratia quinivorans]|uniref:winged helix-turn-helix transcriptional regulator n=1 Tax=Serratia quinivorans TaxID=137545 RepID=UPI002178E7DE|nr:winged helix-turn-helix transcriptional regulator [Serratia quinivorans]CAI1838392.1 putative DNA-binding transcriptional regulator [Serratia quinivorans]CAI1923418.1 putative DNA-binding transcriptional regulator [Serratia quinivorans]
MSVKYAFQSDNIFALAAKPEGIFKHLCKMLAKGGTPFYLDKGEKLPKNRTQLSDVKCVFFIENGDFTLTRREDMLLFATDTAPFIFGLTELFHYPSYFELIADSPCSGNLVLVETLHEKISMAGLWPEVAQVMTYFVQQLTLRDRQLVAVDSYTMVRHKLAELMSLPEEVRQSINVQQFIHQRTGLSRSGVLKILAELQLGEYINIHKGRLISIRTLPVNY